VWSRVARVLDGRRGVAFVVTLVVLSSIAPLALARMPGAVKLTVLYETTYAASFVTVGRTFVDRDGDGYSPILLGGDCDDANAAVHPGAYDAPNDGIDENCSGRDAAPFVPTRQLETDASMRAPSPLNVVLVHMDALRPDHLGFAGYARATSPVLDRFRAGATWFRRAYTPAPSTRFAMASLFTGLDVARIPQRRGGGNELTILPEARTIARCLGDVGYDRVGFTISSVMEHHHGAGDGFRVFHTPWRIEDGDSAHATGAEQTTDAAIAYLRVAHAEPYLLFAHYDCTHAPYAAHPNWKYGTSSIDRYDSALSHCDAELARLFAAIDARDDAARTAVIVYSDHGELLGEHDLTDHGASLYEEDVRVVLLVRIPGARAKTIDTPVSLTDVAPTIMALAGEPPAPAGSAWNLLPLAMRGDESYPADRPIFRYADLWRGGTAHYEARGVVRGAFKYVRDISSSVENLFDEAADPHEETDARARFPAVRDDLAELTDSWDAYASASNAH
jgi:arylsulfatase A-like enzyme